MMHNDTQPESCKEGHLPNTFDLHTVDVCSQPVVAHPKVSDSRASRKEIHLHAHAIQSQLRGWKDRQEVTSSLVFGDQGELH